MDLARAAAVRGAPAQAVLVVRVVLAVPVALAGQAGLAVVVAIDARAGAAVAAVCGALDLDRIGLGPGAVLTDHRVPADRSARPADLGRLDRPDLVLGQLPAVGQEPVGRRKPATLGRAAGQPAMAVRRGLLRPSAQVVRLRPVAVTDQGGPAALGRLAVRGAMGGPGTHARRDATAPGPAGTAARRPAGAGRVERAVWELRQLGPAGPAPRTGATQAREVIVRAVATGGGRRIRLGGTAQLRTADRRARVRRDRDQRSRSAVIVAVLTVARSAARGRALELVAGRTRRVVPGQDGLLAVLDSAEAVR